MPRAVVLSRLILFAFWGTRIAVAAAADQHSHTYTIEAQDLAGALRAFAFQSGREILFTPDVTQGKRSHGCNGKYDDLAALNRILRDTGLSYSVTASEAILVEDLKHQNQPTAYSPSGETLRLAQADSSPVPANSTQATSEPEADSQGKPDNLQEVVVTSNKLRAQNIMDVPSSMQAISGDSLQSTGASAFMDIAGKIPGLQVQDLGPGDKKYVIRGINSTGASTTGIYYGDADISGSNAYDGGGMQADIRLYDLDHIEVLRGPQGTLYGASSMSGTIRFIPKVPGLTTQEGYLSVEGSDTAHGSGNYNVNGAINIPIVDGILGVRLTGWDVEDSGFIDQFRVGTIGTVRGINDDDVKGVRASIRYEPIQDLTIDATYTGQSETANGSSRYTPSGVTSWGGPGIPAVQGCDLCNTDVTQSPWKDDLNVFGLTVNYKTALGTLTGTTNQFDRSMDFTYDSTPILVSFGVPVPAETLEPQGRNINSSEFRFASDLSGPINFVAGAYREYETNHWVSEVVTTNSLGLVNGQFSTSNSQDALTYPGVGDTFFGISDHRVITQYAGFGEATWKVTPRLTLIGGLRYYTEHLEGVQEQTHPFGGFPAGPVLGPVADSPKSFVKFTYKGNVSYKVNEAALLYTTISTGFRSGGLNAQSEPFEPIPSSFAPDSLTNYEVGSKGLLFGGPVDYQADAYVIDWDNIQVPETTSDGAFNFIGNAGKAQVRGVEFEFSLRPIKYLTVGLSGSYQDAHLTEGASPELKLSNPTLGVTGETIPNVPRTQLSLDFDYTRPIGGTWNALVGADANYRASENAYFASNPFNVRLSPYTLINLRIGLTDDVWSIVAFARNLTDKRAQVSAINSIQDPLALLTVRPLTVGLTVSRKF
jgi:iron complex outermembrane recepter protein